jgi:hypothetical protein
MKILLRFTSALLTSALATPGANAQISAGGGATNIPTPQGTIGTTGANVSGAGSSVSSGNYGAGRVGPGNVGPGNVGPGTSVPGNFGPGAYIGGSAGPASTTVTRPTP